MSDIKMTNIPSMNVGKMVEKLSSAYCAIIQNNYPIKTMPSVMLWGPPGVGKSQAVRQIAKEIGEKTGKTVNVTDVRLLLFNPIDLRGIPTANADKTLAVWLKPQIFQMDASDDIVNILFLDEISAAPQSVQAAAYQIKEILKALKQYKTVNSLAKSNNQNSETNNITNSGSQMYMDIVSDLSMVSTAQLVKELSKRETVQKLNVEPYQSYKIKIGRRRISGTGPVVILRVWD